MPGGNTTTTNTTNKSNKPSGQQSKTVQTLLAAKKDKPSEPRPKRTHSEVSNESNTSIDLSALINFQKDLDEIKFSLKELTTKDDLEEVTKDLVKTSDLEILVTGIVKKLFSKFESSLEKKMNDKIAKIQTDVQEKVNALEIENEDLRKRLSISTTQIESIKRDLSETTKLAKRNNISSNFNEQYSRKNNIKVFNFPRKEKQDLRADFIKTCETELNVKLEERDVVAIHRLPSQYEPSPLIVKLFNTDVKRSLMRVRKDLKNGVRFADDVTQRNMELIDRLNKSGSFDSVWYFNCNVYARTTEGLQFKFGLYDDIYTRLKQGK